MIHQVYHINDASNIFSNENNNFKLINPSFFSNINTKEELAEKLDSSENILDRNINEINPYQLLSLLNFLELEIYEDKLYDPIDDITNSINVFSTNNLGNYSNDSNMLFLYRAVAYYQ